MKNFVPFDPVILYGKSIYLAPLSPMTLAFSQFLSRQGIEIRGFIDRLKTGDRIFRLEQVNPEEVDFILILSPNHYLKIIEHCIQFIDKKKLINILIENGDYFFQNHASIQQRKFAFLPSDMNIERRKFVFISKDFISSNNKALYLHCIRNNIETSILTDNSSQIAKLKALNFPCAVLDTDLADLEIAKAKFIIFDQANYTYLPPLHPDQKTVQLWHGVGLKKMSRLDNITYDYFISTSDWTNDSNFKLIFSAHHFLNLGYPRNDVFFRDLDDLDLLFCDFDIHEKILQSNKKIIFYMPTHREDRSELALDLVKLNSFLASINALLIIKVHPFILRYYKSDSFSNLENIFFHNTYGDVYPLLKYADVLISDYSSIVYDFLLLNKSIIFYIHDFEGYTKNMELLFDFDSHSPGYKAANQDELQIALLQEDIYQTERNRVRELFFDTIAQNVCSKNIISHLLSS